jgi:hypothetical protein
LGGNRKSHDRVGKKNSIPMKTYRVYIAREVRNPQTYDWADTILARSAQEALNDSYNKWVESNPHPAPPPLADCVSKVNQVQALEIEVSVLN